MRSQAGHTLRAQYRMSENMIIVQDQVYSRWVHAVSVIMCDGEAEWVRALNGEPE